MYQDITAGLNIRPHPIRPSVRLLLQHFSSQVAIQAKEVCQLSRGINLALPDILALSQHRRRNQLIPILPRHELRRAHEDSNPVNERRVLPVLFSLQRRLNRRVDLLLCREWVVRECGGMLGGEGLADAARAGRLLCFAVDERGALEGDLRAQGF